MPGFNQRGPMNGGPMTGGRRGICTGATANMPQGDFRTGFSGLGRGWGRRCAAGPGFGQGLGPGFGRGFGANAGRQPQDDREGLAQRVRFLEQELNAVRQELSSLDSSE